ncbi:hypothetical protein KIPB_014715, partial [Kipferlia bialata]
GQGPLIHIGSVSPSGETPLYKAFVTELTDKGADFASHAQIENLIWKKLIANVGINCVCAVTGLTSKHLLGQEDCVEFITGLVHEVAAVARAKGISLPVLEDPVAYVLSVLAVTGDNKVSMLQDMEAEYIYVT